MSAERESESAAAESAPAESAAVRLRALVLGWPVRHSRSPAIHRAIGEAAGVPVSYHRLAVPPPALAPVMARLLKSRLSGVNVTSPHKETIVPLMHRITPVARRVGGVNTARLEPEGWTGHNTDFVGAGVYARPVGELAVVVGGGAAARATLLALADAGWPRLVACTRSPERLRALTDWWPVATGASAASFVAAPLGALEGLLSQTGLLIDALPLPAEAVVADAPLTLLPPQARLVTLRYGQHTAALQRTAHRAGRHLVDGSPMLVAQAQEAFAWWTGLRPAGLDPSLMRAAADDDPARPTTGALTPRAQRPY